MFELPGDHIGGDGKVVFGREARAWTNLVRQLNLRDTFEHRVGHLRFSWDNQRRHRHNPANVDGQMFGTRILRRLDRLYAPRPSNNFSIEVTSTILPGFAMSYHAPVLGSLRLGATSTRPSCHRMNTAHLMSEAFCDRIRALWAQRIELGEQSGWGAEETLASCLEGARNIDRCWGKRKAQERRQRLEILQAQVTRAQIALELHPDSPTSQRALTEAKEMLQSLECEKATSIDQVMQARWAGEGDICSKSFFKTFKSMATAKHIHSIIDPDGREVSEWEEMAEQVEIFFRNNQGGTLGNEPLQSTEDHQTRILDLLSDKLTVDENTTPL